ncbi:MAG: peptide-methionine (S)-S-oxide reductase MsrA [Candidatus Methanoperedens sp.]|nr:peptide-methionine (S)-S-oxide reductase MsrA [Candidatus Methanoperedens sp.]
MGGGCFWCLEAIFNELRGVEKVVSGYSGGSVPNPSYQEVCTGTTGHAEVVQITFDPQIISFRELLEVFFTIHDPTTLNRQGPDVGTQYRSVIFYHTQEQKAVAQEVIARLEEAKIWDAPIVTEVTPLTAFYTAEEYHREYFERNPEQPYCRIVIAPKVVKFRKQFLAKLKSRPQQQNNYIL